MKTRELTKEQLKNKRIGQIVVEDYRTTGIFVSNGLNYCCQGDKTIEEACSEKGFECETILYELSKIYRLPVKQQDISMEPDPAFLMEYIINRHHLRLSERIRRIRNESQTRLKEMADLSPPFIGILRKFLDLCDKLELHMRQEEQEVFPLFANLMDGNVFDAELTKALIDSIRNDHKHIGKLFEEIRHPNSSLISPEVFGRLSACELIAGPADQGIPNDICSFYRVLCANLGELESAIRDCIHLENNLFIPDLTKSLQMN